MKRSLGFSLFIFIACAIHLKAIDSPLTPDQAIATFRLDPGLKIECIASEPMVINPVAVAWDEQERMYVVEDTGYPIGPGKGKQPVGRIVRLEDTDSDGQYDKRTVFIDGLTFPNGVMCWKGGIYVTCAPFLYYFKDINDDGIADIKQTVFKGFQDLSTTQLRVSHPVLNVDNWIYLTSGLTSAKVTSPLYPNHPEVYCNRTDFRFRPDTDQFETTAGTAQFGETFDSYGRKFICSNRNHNMQVMMQLKYLARNRDFAFSEIVQDTPDHGAAARVYPLSANITTIALHTGFFTSACGILYYRGTALPDDYRDNSFTCEPAGNLVHRDVLTPTNATFVASRAQDGVEFLASADNWFRPVNLATGPDGALYVCDMYRKTIEHPDYLPEATRKITDFESGKDRGRIYRITAAGKSIPHPKPTLASASVKELCAALENPDVWWRTTAQRLLLEKNDKSAVPFLRDVAKSGGRPEARVLALHLLNTLDSLPDSLLATAMSDKSPGARENALQLSEPHLSKSSEIAENALALANDPNPRVRFQCALSLGELSNPRVIPALAKITMQDDSDRWARAAVLTSVGGRADQLLSQLLSAKGKATEGMSSMLVELCRVVGVSEPADKLSKILAQVLAPSSDADVEWQQAAITGVADGIKASSHHGGKTLTLLSLVSGETTDAAKARERIQILVRNANETALAASNPLSRRLVAIGLLAQTDFPSAGSTLQKLIDPSQPTEIQAAAVRALGQINDSDAANVLVRKDRWSSYTPPVRDVALGTIMSRPVFIQALLTAVRSGAVPAWTVNEDRRNQLMRSKDESIQSEAAALFKDMQAGDRMKVYEEYKSVLTLTPNPANGHAIFSKTCSGCHVVAGEGHLVGPDLTGIRNQPAEVLLLHIIVPEFEIMPTFTCYNLETKDGQSLTGLLAAETPSSITLRQALGHEETVQRANISGMTSSSLSLMPDELEKTMSKQDLADLLGYLKGM